MTIKINTYRKKDGSVMIFINNDRKVSIGDSGRIMTSKFTQGEKKLFDAVHLYFANHSNPIDASDIRKEGEYYELQLGTLYITDTANCGGISTGSDGAFLLRNGKLYDLSESVAVEE